jgi:two-component system chemotaxis response regulator CheB
VSSVAPRSSQAAIKALALGAVDVIAKPNGSYSVPDVGRDLVRAIRTAARARFRQPAKVEVPTRAEPVVIGTGTAHTILAIGASTGGTKAIEAVLTRLPADTPGTVIVQHMPAGFTRSFAARLDERSAMEVREAVDNDLVEPGLALIAPGGYHLLLQRGGRGTYSVRVKDGPPVHHQRPAVDILFHSVAQQAGGNAVGVLLTGMGADGARGLLAMREAGAHTIAEAESSCVVFGMPREAIELGAAAEVAPLHTIASRIAVALRASSTPRRGETSVATALLHSS